MDELSYQTSLTGFIKRLQKHQRRAHIQAGTHTPHEAIAAIHVEVSRRRKFDRLTVVVEGSVDIPVVRYFVSKVPYGNYPRGSIFGAKSGEIPNTLQYFGSVTNTTKWNWCGQYGEPVSDPSVMVSGRYSNVIHYADVPKNDDAATAKVGG